MAETTPQLGLLEWNLGTDYYNHTSLVSNWTTIDSSLGKKTWALTGDEFTAIKFGVIGGTVGLSSSALIVQSLLGTASTATPAFTLTANGSASWGSGTAALDTFLYRSGSAVLALIGEFTASQSIQANAGFYTPAALAATALWCQPSGTSYPTYQFNANGSASWGGGGSATDTNLYRVAVGKLGTDHNFYVGGGTVYLGTGTASIAFNNNNGAGVGTVTVNENVHITGNFIVDGTLGAGGVSLGSAASVTTLTATTANVTNILGSPINIGGQMNFNGSANIDTSGNFTTFGHITAVNFSLANGTVSNISAGTVWSTYLTSASQPFTMNLNGATLSLNGALTTLGIATFPQVNIGSPDQTVKALNLGGGMYVESPYGIFFGNTANSGNRMYLWYNGSGGNSYLDLGGAFYIRNSALNANLMSLDQSGNLTTGGGITLGANLNANAKSITGVNDLHMTAGWAVYTDYIHPATGGGNINMDNVVAAEITTSGNITANGSLLQTSGQVYAGTWLNTPGALSVGSSATISGNAKIAGTLEVDNILTINNGARFNGNSNTMLFTGLTQYLEFSDNHSMVLWPSGSFIDSGGPYIASSLGLKNPIRDVDTSDFLDKFDQLELSHWTWKDSDKFDDQEHFGPFAEPFNKLFFNRENHKTIGQDDEIKVLYAVVKGLHEEVKQLKLKLGD